MSLGVNEESHFHNLAKALGRADWLEDPRFIERSTRKANAALLSSEIEAELAKKTAAEWEPILQSAGVPSARLRSLPEALASEQVTTRKFVHRFEDGLEVPTLPFRLGGVDAYAPRSNPPKQGEHTDEVSEWLSQLT